MALVPLQQADPLRYKAWVESSQQPGAQLQETQAAAGAAGASAARTMAELPIVQADTQRLGIINQAGNVFEKNKGKDGFIKPDVYNKYKAAFVQAGGNGQDFDNKFEANYVSPNNVFYDTPDAKAARGVLPVIKNVVDSYHSLKDTGPVWQTISQLPGIGKLLTAGKLAPEEAHNSFLLGQAGNIRALAGAGPNQGFRFNLQELNNIIGLLPQGYDTEQQKNQKLDRLNSFLNSKMGVGLKDVLGGSF